MFPSYKHTKHGVLNKRLTGLLCFELQMMSAFVTQKKKEVKHNTRAWGLFISSRKKQKTVYTHIYAFSPRGMHLQPLAKDNKRLLFFHRVPFPHQKIIVSSTKGSRKSSRECVIAMKHTLEEIIKKKKISSTKVQKKSPLKTSNPRPKTWSDASTTTIWVSMDSLG